MSIYTPEEYTMTITLEESSIANRYAKALALSMQRSKDTIASSIFNSAFRNSDRPMRLKEDNPYIHGALNAIRKQTETL